MYVCMYAPPHTTCMPSPPPPSSQLVVMTPKSLLRHADARSPISDMTEGEWSCDCQVTYIHSTCVPVNLTEIFLSHTHIGTSFQRVYVDRECGEGVKVRRVIFCTGKIYYELRKEREALGMTDTVALIRIEQVVCVCTRAS